MRLNKFIALNLPTSRRKADDLIQSGEVTVNGKVPEVGYIVNQNDIVSVNNKNLSNNNAHEYYKFYKPKGYVCSHNKQGDAPTIYDLIGKNYLKFGGRLDKDSEGLMLLSTDGEWLNEIFHSKNKIEKIYKVTLKNKINKNKKIRTKITHEGQTLKIHNIKAVNSYSYNVTLLSGKNHEIRKIFRFNDLVIRQLKREKIGRYTLGNMSKGQLSKIEL
ncbi:MAG: rRNA pseudouridine synthase [Proteobacteria bacterium]|nr:rRNA pseudouridine synthase [Pseudomonadota bacterium]